MMAISPATPTPNGDVLRPAIVGEHRSVDLPPPLASGHRERAVPEAAATVVTLNDIRLGAPPPDAALVVVLPRFAPHSALDQAADLGVTADWPILGVIGIRHRSWLAALSARAFPALQYASWPARRPETPVADMRRTRYPRHAPRG